MVDFKQKKTTWHAPSAHALWSAPNMEVPACSTHTSHFLLLPFPIKVQVRQPSRTFQVRGLLAFEKGTVSWSMVQILAPMTPKGILW